MYPIRLKFLVVFVFFLPFLLGYLVPITMTQDEIAVYVQIMQDANVRAEPSSQANIIGQVRRDEVLEFVQEIPDGQAVNQNPLWYEIVFEGQTAFVWSGVARVTRTIPIQDGVVMFMGDNIPTHIQTLSRQAIQNTLDYFESMGYGLAPLDFYIYHDLDEAVEAYLAYIPDYFDYIPRSSLGMANRDRAYETFRLSNRWGEGGKGFAFNYVPNPNDPDRWIYNMLVHEMYHTFQHNSIPDAILIPDGNPIPRTGPVWLIEGSAEWFAWRIKDINNVESFEQGLMELGAPALRSSSQSLDDASVRESNLFSLTYHGGAVAVHYLTLLTDEVNVHQYWQNFSDLHVQTLANQSNIPVWKASFKEAFGLTMDDFYILFEAFDSQCSYAQYSVECYNSHTVTHVIEGMDVGERQRVEGVITDMDGQPIENVYVYLCEAHGTCFQIQTDVEGSFLFYTGAGNKRITLGMTPSRPFDVDMRIEVQDVPVQIYVTDWEVEVR